MTHPIQPPDPLVAINLSDLARIRHGFFTREKGVSEGVYASLNCGWGSRDSPERVSENRRRASHALLAGSAGILTLYQEHGSTALEVTEMLPCDSLPRADALVTRTPGLVIGVLTADCAPVLLADPEAQVIAAAHAGWRGAVGGVLAATVTKMQKLGASLSRIRAAVGPAIGPDAYEVGPDFETELNRLDPPATSFLSRPSPESRAHFDLPGYVASRLKAAGISSVEASPACTYENESKFFSFRRTTHRKETDYGRQISAIVLT